MVTTELIITGFLFTCILLASVHLSACLIVGNHYRLPQPVLCLPQLHPMQPNLRSIILDFSSTVISSAHAEDSCVCLSFCLSDSINLRLPFFLNYQFL